MPRVSQQTAEGDVRQASANSRQPKQGAGYSPQILRVIPASSKRAAARAPAEAGRRALASRLPRVTSASPRQAHGTFEVLDLPGSGPMETRRVVKLYEPSLTPIVNDSPVSNVLGRVPLMPLILRGNSTPIIQHCFCEQIPIRLCRRRQGVGREGKQRLRGQPMVVALCDEQASPGGSVSVCDRGAANGCDARRG